MFNMMRAVHKPVQFDVVVADCGRIWVLGMNPTLKVEMSSGRLSGVLASSGAPLVMHYDFMLQTVSSAPF